MADGSITVTREASMEELRKSVAELLGEPADWPDHGNAPLAIAATMALLLEGCKRLEAENATLKRDLQYARDGLYYFTEPGDWRGPDVDEFARWHAVAQVAVRDAEPLLYAALKALTYCRDQTRSIDDCDSVIVRLQARLGMGPNVRGKATAEGGSPLGE